MKNPVDRGPAGPPARFADGVRESLVDVIRELVFSDAGLGLDPERGDPLALAVAANAVGAFNQHLYDLVMPGFAERGLVGAYRPLEVAAAAVEDESENVKTLAALWFASRGSDGDSRPADVGVEPVELGVRRTGPVVSAGGERLDFERIVAAFDLRSGAIVASGPRMSDVFIGHFESLGRPVSTIFAGRPFDHGRFRKGFARHGCAVHILHSPRCRHERRGQDEGFIHRGLSRARTLARSFAETTPPLARSSDAEVLLAIVSWNVRMAAFYREHGPGYVEGSLYETSPYVALAEDA
jgi:hypothetical protein